MSTQDLDMRSSIKAVRRHGKLFAALVVIGILIGAAYAVLRPPTLTSTALVVLQQTNTAQNNQSSSADQLSGEIGTQVVIASSYPVLSAALPHASPAMSVQQLNSRITVQSLAGSIISVTGTGTTAAQAEATTNAVANSYVAYVSSGNSPVTQMSAKVLESASSAAGAQRLPQIAIGVLLGAAGGALVGLAAALAMSRKDRRLVGRDAIAGSIGAPVLASMPVARPSGAAAWAKLLADYQPGSVPAWGLTRMLRQLGVAAGEGEGAEPAEVVSVAVISLSSDPRALALGPQLAAFAAAQGIPTALVIGPQQDLNVTAALRTACAVPPEPRQGSPEPRQGPPEGAPATEGPAQAGPARHKPLQLVVRDNDKLGPTDAALVVVVAVVDSRAPLMPGTVPADTTVLGVSAGGTTAEQLARAATAAAADGREVTGILVADPDPADQSTGRTVRLELPRRQLPTRVHDVPTEAR
jgi:capsular polysaccharide biosynthesis protein